VKCLEKRLGLITPWVALDARQEKFDAETADELLGPWQKDGVSRVPDFIVDCIDNIDTKVYLLKYCHERKLPIISASGAGAKTDPTRIMIGDIAYTHEDPLARSTRRKLKLQDVTSGIPVVYSMEKPGKSGLLPLSEEEFEKGDIDQLGALPGFRVRILPALGTIPASFGYTIANHIILTIAGYPISYPTSSLKSRDRPYDAALAYLQGREEALVRAETANDPTAAIGLKIPITAGDVSCLVDEIYRGRSVISGVPTRLCLVRWRKPDGPVLKRIGSGKNEQKSSNVRMRDLACMTKEEATVHFEKVIMGEEKAEDLYSGEVVAEVQEKLSEAEEAEDYRRGRHRPRGQNGDLPNGVL
jgi:tRNA threonylcarbamoyladenosine dehydratase